MNDSLDIPSGHLDLAPVDGFIHDWLIAGPLATPAGDLADYRGTDIRHALLRNRRQVDAGMAGPPAERAEFEVAVDDGQTVRLRWVAQQAQEDHIIDLSGFHAEYHRVTAWAYAQIICPGPVQTPLTLAVYSPADLWLNGAHRHRHDGFHDDLAEITVAAQLSEGVNELLLRLETVAVRDYALGFRLLIPAARDPGYRVALPTLLEPVARRQKLAQVMEHAYLTRDIFQRGDSLEVHWSAESPQTDALAVRLQTPAGRIFSEALPIVQRNATVVLNRSLQTPDGDYEVLLMPQGEEYYIKDMRVTRRLPLRVVNGKFSTAYYGDAQKRRREALEDAARRTGDIYAELAKLALGQWDQLNVASINRAIGRVQQRAAGSHRDLLALIAIAAHHGDDGVLPQEVQWALAEGIQGAKLAPDDAPDGLDFTGEGHALLSAACELLAGQLYPDHEFAVSGRAGAWHRQAGEAKAVAWLTRHTQQGFRAWDGAEVLADAAAILGQLVELVESDEVAELAAVMLDRLAFGLAVHSWRGVFGGSQGAAQERWLRSGRLSPVAGVMRLLWGMGGWNSYCHAPVSLAMASGYELPEIIAAVALDAATDAWTQEQHAGEDAEGAFAANLVTYRTADYLLASAQDYRPGQPGRVEHIWQATLGPDALVFVNDPACSSMNDALRPNFWRGNAALPRVAQWRDVLVAVHRGAGRAALDFTHAYFPAAVFDEYSVADGWAFARKDHGYIALRAAAGVTLVTRGRTAFRELRAPGRDTVWVCQMGRAATDGTFAEFVAKVKALSIAYVDDGVRLTSLRGQTVEFGWTGALVVDGEPQPLHGYPHTTGPYGEAELPATTLDIHYAEHRLRLNLAAEQPDITN